MNLTFFINKIYLSLKNASCEKLVDISHDDSEWQKLSKNVYSQEIMDVESHVDYYKKKYRGLIETLHI